ncbi:MAG: hypothetical protein ACO3F2_09370 [Roseiflexaceae bacterium]|jgi:hypothetical protein
MTDSPIKAIPYHVNWLTADKGRIREEIAQIAERGLTHAVLSPAWFRLQPRPHHIDRGVMATLESCYDAANRVGLSMITTLLTTAHLGSLELPDWHHTADVIGWLQGRTTTPIYRRGGIVQVNGLSRRLQLANPYRTDTYREGQHELVRVVMGYFAGHEAARHWLLAPGWSYLADVSPHVAKTWWQELTALARRVHTGAVLMAQIDAPQLLGHGFDAVLAGCEVDMVVVDTAMPLLPQRQRRLPLLPMQFLHYVVAGLTQRPTIIGMHPLIRGHMAGWQSLRWYDRPLAVPVLTDVQIMDVWYAQVAVMQHQAVAGLVYPRGWHVGRDYDRDGIDALPALSLDSVMRQIDMRMRDWQRVGAAHGVFDSERYQYNPQKELLRLWQEFSS